MQIIVLRENVLHKNNKHSQLDYQTVHLGPVSTTAYGSEITDGDGLVGTRTYRALKINTKHPKQKFTPNTETDFPLYWGCLILNLHNTQFT